MHTDPASDPSGQSDTTWRPRRAWLAAWLMATTGVLSGCAAWTPGAAREASLPLRLAWFQGKQIEYISTDTSDAGMARDMGINYVPRLADAVPPDGAPPGTPSSVDLVYMFPGGEQLNVFPSAPQPAGSGNANRAYSPLWRVVMVSWAPGRTARQLTSEEALLDAADKGELRLTRTRIVVNCPVLRSADGSALAGLR